LIPRGYLLQVVVHSIGIVLEVEAVAFLQTRKLVGKNRHSHFTHDRIRKIILEKHSHVEIDIIHSGRPIKSSKGQSDYYEYALGSHPTNPSLTDPRHQKLAASTYRLLCNPDAPEVLRRLEVSSDLQSWRPALASEVRLPNTRSCLTWTLQPGFQHLFCRVKIIVSE
ncbi:hypothetical protein N9F13_01025, partial [Akkermansiaceae bacterium]|nr:hypothetical protein [Akkermansiaceae bacterium]